LNLLKREKLKSTRPSSKVRCKSNDRWLSLEKTSHNNNPALALEREVVLVEIAVDSPNANSKSKLR
jgi:hypothetical protein